MQNLNTELAKAVAQNSLKRVRQLLFLGADPNALFAEEFTVTATPC